LKLVIFVLLFTVVIFSSEPAFSEEILSCTIEKSLTTGIMLEKPKIKF